MYEGVRQAGYVGVQHDVPLPAALAAGLAMSGIGRVLQPADADEIARRHRDAGFVATSLHVGHGLEDDLAAAALVEAVLNASARRGYPLLVETHRATLTQDIWRTLHLIGRFPELRFNADLSHWYTGLEMPYGDFAAKLDALEPVFRRVRFIHGRIGNPGSMQVPIVLGDPQPAFMRHFREMWTRCAQGFLATADSSEQLIFAPELLPATLYADGIPVAVDYARTDRSGEEESDRWEQALQLCGIFSACVEAAERRTAADATAAE